LLYGGVLCEDLDFQHSTYQLFESLTAKQNRENDNLEGFSFAWDDSQRYGATLTDPTIGAYTAVEPSSSRTVSFRPLFGLLNQPKYLPLMWNGGLVIRI
jgi:hypothetical protein